MQTFASDFLHPEWNYWETYICETQVRALQLDALRSSHPIQVPIKRGQDVEEVFDAISYCKGGSVVRMMFAVLGKEKFQEGLRSYFQKHKYGNTETFHLWQAWAEASGKPIEKMMDTWTTAMGFPVLKVVAAPKGDEIEIEQSWFLGDGSKEAGDDDKTWVIPVFAGSDKGAAPLVLMEQKRQTIKCGQSGAWLKVNFGQHIPCRVLYPEAMLNDLVKGMSTVPAEDRIGLLSDGLALCKAGMSDPVQLVKLLEGFQNEKNDKVWTQLDMTLREVGKIVKAGLDESTATAFTDFAARLVVPAFEAVGWDNVATDTDNSKALRNTLVGCLAKYCGKQASVVAEAKKRCEAFLAAPGDLTVLGADIRLAVLSVAVQSGDAELVERLIKAHGSLTDAAVRTHLYQALGEAPTAELRTRVLQWSLTEEVRSQDFFYVAMGMLGQGKVGAESVFAWVQSEFEAIYGRVGQSSMIIFNVIVRLSGAGFVTTERADEVEKFWKSKEVYKMVEKTVAQVAEGIKTSSKFVEHLSKSEVAKPAAWAKKA